MRKIGEGRETRRDRETATERDKVNNINGTLHTIQFNELLMPQGGLKM